MTVGGLATDKPYDFELRLYGAAGETSWHTSMEASTLPITPLAKPEVTVSQQGAYVRVEWKPVENAEYYHCYYTVGDLPLELVTSDTHCLLAGLAPGKHSVGVTADTEYGGYTESERTEAQAVRSRTKTGTVTGTYTSGLMQRKNKWECTMHIYDDGTYRIDSFYQTPGYDLDFYVDTDTETGASYIGLLNFKSITAVNDYRIETGRKSVPEIGVLTGLVDGELASSFTGDATSGLVTFTTTYSTLTRTDKFEW